MKEIENKDPVYPFGLRRPFLQCSPQEDLLQLASSISICVSLGLLSLVGLQYGPPVLGRAFIKS